MGEPLGAKRSLGEADPNMPNIPRAPVVKNAAPGEPQPPPPTSKPGIPLVSTVAFLPESLISVRPIEVDQIISVRQTPTISWPEVDNSRIVRPGDSALHMIFDSVASELFYQCRLLLLVVPLF